ncbi:uncharacterized protein SCODWIG_00245 [Saccharomycodes ludwigii]|uniref:PH domain-containing protein n=1 Tax=Saccharomycodes ludwigii TaxID=36035 RepID=A0A376B1Y3_9ASCO|nr:hypothetical protein SCDLUD_001774 [Saccharomycodes ludwigii]KAH3901986.1 hypothetical protein SCDLUD_001774 [Saccharomycodes ludwigii]SSD58484.1 uncharacterized protein SCODWIG_00245 [Saccharomycodes ludwigii]
MSSQGLSNKRSSRSDLRSQLEDIQRKIDRNNSMKKQKQYNENSNDIIVSNSPLERKLSTSSKRKSSGGGPFSTVLSKRRDSSSSLPMFPGSTTHENVISNLGSTQKDMGFVMDLSDNLLMECRKLQAQVKQKNTTLQELEIKYQALKVKFDEIDKQQTSLVKENVDLKDSNWDLDMKYRELKKNFDDLTIKFVNQQTEFDNQIKNTNDLKLKLEESLFEKNGLDKDFKKLKQEYMSEVKDLKNYINDLNNENDELHEKLEVLNVKLTNLNSQLLQSTKPTLSKDLSQQQGPHLEVETLKVSLETANKTIHRLQQDLDKLRSKDTTPLMSSGTDIKTSSSSTDQSDSDTEERVPLSEDIFDSAAKQDSEDEQEDDSDSIDEIVQKYVKSHNYILVPATEYEKLQTPKKELSDTDHCKILEEKGYKIFSANDFQSIEKRLKTLEFPPLELLQKEASKHNHVLLSNDNYSTLMAASESTLDLQQLKETASQVGYELVDQDTYKDLNRPLTLDDLKLKATVLGYTIIPDEDHAALIKPKTLEATKNLAHSFNHVAIPAEEYTDLKTSIESPTLDQIALHAKNHDMTLINFEELNKLKSSYESPSKDYILEKTKNFGLVPVESTVYNDLLSHKNSPSLDFINNHLLKLNKTIIDFSELDNLKTQIKNPSREYLEDHASDIECLLVDSLSYNNLKENINSPSIDYLKQKAEQASYTLLSLHEFKNLTDELSQPKLQYLKDKASTLGYVVINLEDYQKLTKKASNPTKDELIESASRLGYTLVPGEELKDLRYALDSPSINYIEEKARVYGLVTIEEDKLNDLKNKSNNRESILDNVKLHGFIPVPIADFNVLENSTVSKASISGLKPRLEELNYVPVPITEYESLITPLTERANKNDTLELCEKYGLKPVTLEEYETLRQKSTEPILSEHDVMSYAKEHNNTVIPIAVYNEMKQTLESPSLDKLKDYALKYNLTLLETGKYNDLASNHASPSIDYVKEKANSLGYEVVPHMDYNEMKNNIDEPSRAFIVSAASKLGLITLTDTEFKGFTEKIESPSDEYIMQKLTENGKVALDAAEFDTLKRKIEYPTVEELQNSCKTQNLVLLPEFEYQTMVTKLETPDLAYIQDAASKIDYKLVKSEVYEQLIKTSNSPDIEFLITKAADYGKIVVSKNEYEQHKAISTNPTVTDVKRLSSMIGLTSISTSAYTALQDSLDHPSLDYLKSKATENGSVLLSEIEFNSLKNPSIDDINSLIVSHRKSLIDVDQLEAFKNPDLEWLKKSSQKHGYSLIENKELTCLQNPTFDNLKNHISRLNCEIVPLSLLNKEFTENGNILLDKDTFEELMDSSIDTMTKEKFIEFSKKFYLKAIPVAEYKTLITPLDEEGLQEEASQLGYIAIRREEYDFIKAASESPDEDTINKSAANLGMCLVNIKEYETLKNESNNPTKADFERKANKLGLVVMPEDKYKSLLKDFKPQKVSTATTPSSKVLASKEFFEQVIRDENRKDVILESGRSLGFVRLSTEEYKKLLEGQKKHLLTKGDIYSGAKDFNLTVLPSDEYRALLRKRNTRDSFTLADLNTLARRMRMKLIPVESTAAISSESPDQDDSYISCHSNSSFASLVHTRTKEKLLTASDSNNSIHSLLAYDSPNNETAVLLDMQTAESPIDNTPQNADDPLKKTAHKVESVAEPVYENQNVNYTFESLEKLALERGYVLVPKLEYENKNTFVETAFSSPTEGPEHVEGIKESNLENGTKEMVINEKFDSKNLETKGEIASDNSTSNSEPSVEGKDLDEVENNDSDTFNNETSTLELIVQNKDCEDVEGSAGDDDDDSDTSSFQSTWDENTILERASKIGLTVLPTLEYEKLKAPLTVELLEEEANKLGFKMLPYENYEELIKPIDSDVIRGKATAFGLKVITDDEYTNLSSPPEIKDLKELATKNDMTLITIEEHNSLINPPDEYLAQLAEKRQMNLVPHEAYKELVSKPTSVEALQQLATPLQAVVVPQYEFSEMSVKAQEYPGDEESLGKLASKFGLCVIEVDELESIKDKLKDSVPKDKIPEYLKSTGLEVVDSELADKVQDFENKHKDGKLNKEELMKQCVSQGYALIPENELRDMEKLLEDSILTNKNISQKAKLVGYTAIPTQDFEELNYAAEKSLTEPDVYKLAESMGLCVVTREEYETLQKIHLGDLNGTADVTTSEVPAPVFREMDSDIVSPAMESAGGKNTTSIDENDLLAYADAHALMLVSKEKYRKLLKANDVPILSKEEVVERARDFGLIAIDQAEFDGINQQLANNDMNEDTIVTKAAEFGLVPIKKEYFQEIKEELEHPSFTKEQIMQEALNFNLVILDKSEYKQLKRASVVGSSNMSKRSKNNTLENASFSPPASSIPQLDNQQQTLDPAASISRKVIIEDVDEDASSINTEQQTTTPAPGSMNTGELKANCEKLGFLCIPERLFVTTATCPKPKSSDVVVLPKDYYVGLLEFSAKKNDEADKKHSASGNNNNTPSGSRSSASSFISKERANVSGIPSSGHNVLSNRSGVPVPLPKSSDTHSDKLSLVSVSSLTEPSIIPALTQTVIGEYLYKYYHRFGVFTNVRHERYFWVHPYTMTLYWSTSNPVLDSPQTSKTKGAAITGVKSVDDPNPFPPGVYHKSIIIKTDSREIKITCSTRQRHNIWYNSLRYLLQKNMDGINLEAESLSRTEALLRPLANGKSQAQKKKTSTRKNSSLNKKSSFSLRKTSSSLFHSNKDGN